jgi:tRNA(adenine34) deaminase
VNHRCEITAGGVLEDECRDLIRAYFQFKRTEPSVE